MSASRTLRVLLTPTMLDALDKWRDEFKAFLAAHPNETTEIPLDDTERMINAMLLFAMRHDCVAGAMQIARHVVAEAVAESAPKGRN